MTEITTIEQILQLQINRKLSDIASRLPPKKQGYWWYKTAEVVLNGKAYRVGGFVRKCPTTGDIETKDCKPIY